jgi:DNA invertase Pin-like site-specific DNA recombinase
MHMKKVCCLYRVSTLGQVDKNDIPMQKTACHRFAEIQGWEIVEEHAEKGVSGYKVSAEKRDAIQDIKRSARSGGFDVLLVFMFDRLGRKEDETPFVVQWFVQQGIEVWSTQEGQQRFDNHVDKLMNYIRFWQASGESEKTSIRTRTRMGQIVQEGRFKGGSAAYGYRLERQGRFNKQNNEVYEIVVENCEASVVQTIFEWYANQGMGTHQIAMQLTRQGIPSRSGAWHPATVLNMLKNVVYTGVLRSGESQSEPFEHLRIIEVIVKINVAFRWKEG